MTDFTALAAPFPPERVSWRVGVSNKKKRQRETGDNFAKATKGQVLAYIDARDVMERLDAVCGPGGWQCRYPHAAAKTVCEIGLKVGDEWVWKSDGAGDSDIEAVKGSLSDSFKRAAVRWGIGRYLYDLPTPWVDLGEREEIPDGERRKLERLLVTAAQTSAPADAPKRDRAKVVALTKQIAEQKDRPALDAWGKEHAAEIELLHPEDREQVRGTFRAQINTFTVISGAPSQMNGAEREAVA